MPKTRDIKLKEALAEFVETGDQTVFAPGTPGARIAETLINAAMASPKSARWIFETFEGKATQRIETEDKKVVEVEIVVLDRLPGANKQLPESTGEVIDGELGPVKAKGDAVDIDGGIHDYSDIDDDSEAEVG